jgi:hypothetical protein
VLLSANYLAVLYPVGKRGVKYFFPIPEKSPCPGAGGWGMRRGREICLRGKKINFFI